MFKGYVDINHNDIPVIVKNGRKRYMYRIDQVYKRRQQQPVTSYMETYEVAKKFWG